MHLEDWRTATQAEFDAALQRFLSAPQAADGWVVDGNYATRLTAVDDAADTVVWLDHPRWFTMARLLRRSVRRRVRRERLWNGNRERWRSLLSREPMENVLVWAWTQHAGYRSRYGALAAADEMRSWIRLRGPHEARRWLRDLQV